jgi:ABC-type Fe3+-hydroxamate transport system substrate-binding protein
MKTFKDQIGRKLQFEKTPKRIICLVPSLTELLVDLGLENSIIGVTKFCMHPTHLRKSKTVVGGTKKINIDEIKALQPDIILCNKEENTKEIVSQCSEIAQVYVSDIYTIKDTLEVINWCGEIFNCTEKAIELNTELHQLLDNFNVFIKDKKTLKVAYFIWKNPWMVAGNKTFINHLLSLNKYENIFSSQDRYPEIELKNLENNTDLILLSSDPYPFNEKHILEIKEYSKTSKIILVNGEYFSWYGSRLLKAFDYFKELRNTIQKISI